MTTMLQTAVELATRERDQAAQLLAQARQNWLAGQMQLDQLENYAQETGTRWQQRTAPCDPALLRHHYQFMERLTHAIRLQTSVVTEQGLAVERGAQMLLARERRLESLRQLIVQREQAALHAARRREQRASDDQAAQLARRFAARTEGGM